MAMPRPGPRSLPYPSLVGGSRLVAVLGPTNTGKTHLAIERMLDHQSGMIGFPLRLLARENYDRIVRLRGARAVALITGEEKILPPNPSYFVCTVESMPLDRPVEFLAIDEIQLCADPERGHVFTARLLHARGLSETMFLGADTIRPLMRRLVPEAEYISRPRLLDAVLHRPQKGDAPAAAQRRRRLCRRRCVLARRTGAAAARRHRGRARRALSPRARNAQVGMFQAGEVDYLVATDAIGMGLNMDLDHVAFARLAKFDGRGPRRLSAAEIAQIAGRAGRHMSDGTFGTTADEGPLDPAIVAAVEEHRFEPLTHVSWRNTRLRFDTVGALLQSLDERPPKPGLVQTRDADDHRALQLLSRNAEVMALATNPGAVRLLWEVCQIPDFRKVMSDSHARFLAHCFGHLARARPSACRANGSARQMAQLDLLDGDIDTLMARIAHIRTWTYITHRSDWVDGAADWQERARGIEDRLSDALHDRITQRFVDRRSAFLVRHLAGDAEILASVDKDGEVRVEGTYVGRLDGFRFVPDTAAGDAMRTLVTAANRVLRSEVMARARRLAAEGDAAFAIDAQGAVLWQGAPVGRLVAGESMLTPRVELRAGDFLDGEARERVRQRLASFVRSAIETPPRAAFRRPGAAAGRCRTRRCLPARRCARLPRGRRCRGAAEGARHAEPPRAWPARGPLRPRDDLRRAVARDRRGAVPRPALGGSPRPRRPVASRARQRGKAIAVDPELPASFYAAIGRRVIAGLALRPDRLERLAAAARTRARLGRFSGRSRVGGNRRGLVRRVAPSAARARLSRGDRRGR